jgi:hypothetical protein
MNQFAQSFGFFDVEFQRIEQEQPADYMDVSKIKIRKANGTRRAFGFVDINKRIDKDLMISVQVYMKRGGQYQLLPYRHKAESICKYMEADPYEFMEQFGDSSNLTTPVVCPVEPVS